MHVAVSSLEKLTDYCLNTPADGYRSAASVKTLKKQIARNLEFLSKNQHNEMPQKVFEVGKVIIGGDKERIFSSCVISNSTVNYEELSSILDALISNLGYKLKLEKVADNRFIKGRVAKVFVDKKLAGVIGEITPAVLENFGLETPVAAFEIELEFLIGSNIQ